MQLTKQTESTAVQSIPKADREIVLLKEVKRIQIQKQIWNDQENKTDIQHIPFENKRLSDYTGDEVLRIIPNVLQRCKSLVGHGDKNEDVVQATIIEIAKRFKSSWSVLFLSEFIHFMEAGSIGEYETEAYNLSFKVVNSWHKEYMNKRSIAHSSLALKRSELQLKEQTEKDKALKDRFNQEFDSKIKAFVDSYKAGESKLQGNLYLYDELRSRGRVNFSDQTKENILQEGYKLALRRLKSEREQTQSIYEKRRLQNEVNSVEANPKHHKVKVAQYEVAFKYWIEENG